MKALVAAACIAILAFVGYYFWGEYERARAAASANATTISVMQSELERVCDEWVAALESWKSGNPDGRAASFIDARNNVEKCLKVTEGTGWHSKNLSVKYW